ncbi:chymotrypsin-C [Mobula hypostoma]|uniref:chymotrypsin-C n=1 Tax=Mobula hypostoma TaxID=723540 RepID=UPI002FC2BDEF
MLDQSEPLIVLVLMISHAFYFGNGLQQKVGFLDWPEDCGIPQFLPNVAGRIISGNEARPHSWPWQVSLQERRQGSKSYSHICGGTLIHSHWILTAAHCFQKGKRKAVDTANWRIVLGKHNLNHSERTEKIYRVKRIYRHERFYYPRHSEIDNDIALVRSAVAISQNNYIRYACMPKKDIRLQSGQPCWATGWGATRVQKENVVLSEVLNQARMPIIDHQTCKMKKFWGDRVRSTMICAGLKDIEGSPAACQGDSGGPLLCQNSSGKWEVHGVVSFGPMGCIGENKPSVFTRITAYLPWIEKTKIRDFFLD